MCGNNNTFVRKSSSSMEALGSKIHFQQTSSGRSQEREEEEKTACPAAETLKL